MMGQRQRDRDEWVRLNTCRFCIGSHLHSCTGYSCRDAIKQAEECFERMERIRMTEYNSFPENMQEMTESAWNDFFTYCIAEYESRQAYKNNLHEQHEDLRIAWVRKEQNLGFCIGRKSGEVKFYQIGSDEQWMTFKRGFAAQFSRDNS